MPYNNSHMDTVAFRDFEHDIHTLAKQSKKKAYVASYTDRHISRLSGCTRAGKIRNLIEKETADTGAEFVSISNFSDGSVLITYRK